MKSVETEGKTIEDAISRACGELKAPREDLEIEVLTQPSGGFLGLGARNAKIRASLKPKPEAPPPVVETPPFHAASDPAAEAARKVLVDMLRLLEVEATVDLKEESERILLNIIGDGSGLLIGRKGQTLDAIEYLVNKIVHRGAEDKKRIVIDTENYRLRREESLVKMAERLAEKAKKLGRPITISPMSAHDRRIIHLALQEDKTLRTWSTGTGLYRKIVISPEKKSS
ncbi:MAG TPA: RNA-binding cell elongation regulator Jag/EloR [Thermodesulfobacteriota bacterium]|nr:RNA-binding cell elongation regulator Jag/EloR [Thermodesulfobacteriota bacterium]